MDLPLKVHSHRRSGTHLLMATLAANFELGDLSIEADVPGQRWHATGESRAIVPWGRLFGDHEPFSPRADPGRMLYIVRDPRDTLRSLWQFESPTTPLGDFLSVDRIRYWYRHSSEYCARVFWIRFEDLTGEGFAAVMERIAARFDLRWRLPEAGSGGQRSCFRRIEGPVGWSPGAGGVGSWPGWPAEWRERFAAAIPDGFLGYRLRQR